MRTVTKYEKVLLDMLSNYTNRGSSQSAFLFELCDFDFDRFCLLEEKLQNNFVHYCPSTKEDVTRLLNLVDKASVLSFENLKLSHTIKITKKWK